MFIDVISPSYEYEYHVNPFQANVQIMENKGGRFFQQNLSKNIHGKRPVFVLKISLFLRYFFAHLASINKISGIYISGRKPGNGSNMKTFLSVVARFV